jgi:exodeoxyribonuclease VII small subunit
MTKKIENPQSFEEAMEALEGIAAQLEGKTLPLDEAVNLYKQAMDLALYCERALGKAKKEVQQLVKTLDGWDEAPFEDATDGQ